MTIPKVIENREEAYHVLVRGGLVPVFLQAVDDQGTVHDFVIKLPEKANVEQMGAKGSGSVEGNLGGDPGVEGRDLDDHGDGEEEQADGLGRETYDTG